MLLHQSLEPIRSGTVCARPVSLGFTLQIAGVEALVEALFSLREPWRTRFLVLVSYMATGDECGSGLPGQDQVRTWLSEDPRLRYEVGQLVDAWPTPAE